MGRAILESVPKGNELGGEVKKKLTIASRLDLMIMEARTKGIFIRAFDVRYATEGIPELGEDHLYFPGGSSFEVLETGPLNGPSTNTQPLKYGKMVPLNAILLIELVDSHKAK